MLLYLKQIHDMIIKTRIIQILAIVAISTALGTLVPDKLLALLLLPLDFDVAVVVVVVVRQFAKSSAIEAV